MLIDQVALCHNSKCDSKGPRKLSVNDFLPELLMLFITDSNLNSCNAVKETVRP